jgi:hypothetical protein
MMVWTQQDQIVRTIFRSGGDGLDVAISSLFKSPQMAQARWHSARTSFLIASGMWGRLLPGFLGQDLEKGTSDS